jgi:hypothetical protein
MSPRQLCLDLNPLTVVALLPNAPYFISLLCLMPDNFTRQGEKCWRSCNRLNTQVTNLVLYYAVELNVINDRPRSDLCTLPCMGKATYE